MANRKWSELSVQELQSELQKKQQKLKGLQRQRDRLQSQLDRLDREIAMLGGPGAKGGRRAALPPTRQRAKNKMSLADTLASVLDREKPMGVPEAAEAVQKAGYKTHSRIFNTIVNQTLLKDKRFKQTSRGKYVLAAPREQKAAA